MRVTFYHQVRADGGRRTGLSIGGSRGIENFVPGDDSDDFDPALRWYVDVTWELADPPRTQVEARAFYTANLAELRRVLRAVADELRAGIDGDLMPWSAKMPSGGGEVTVALSAQRRCDGATIAEGIRAALTGDVDALAGEGSVACAAG